MSAGVALLVFILAFVIFSMVLKVPVSFGLAIASLFVYLGTNMNPITVAQYSFASLDSFALLAIPFYIFAGVLMEYSGISKLVVNWIQSIIGRIRGSIRETLKACGGNRTEAMRRLGLSRRTFYRKCEKLEGPPSAKK